MRYQTSYERTWTLSVYPDADSPLPDIEWKGYASYALRPEKLVFIFRQDEKGITELLAIRVTARRVLKNGDLGAQLLNPVFSPWAAEQKILNIARAELRREARRAPSARQLPGLELDRIQYLLNGEYLLNGPDH